MDGMHGTGDVQLSAKLAEEIKYEQEALAAEPEEPEFIQSIKEQGIWTVSTISSCMPRYMLIALL